MSKDLVHKIREFQIGTKLSEVEEFMNRDEVIDPQLYVAQGTQVERRPSHIVRHTSGSSEHDEDVLAYNHVTVTRPVYLIHYKEKKN